MFLPPEQRNPGPLPAPPPARRELSKREESVLLWAVCLFLLLMVLAPIGGGTVLQALWYFARH